jgi:hypothetical protein
MGPSENPTGQDENQEAGRRNGGRRKRRARRPRRRRCLLKGCEQRFCPRQARQRYCSRRCREAAREWSRWKAQGKYRATRAGQQKRNGQSRRYRERVRKRKRQEKETVAEAARVITKDFFWRVRATGRVATKDSSGGGGAHCNGSARTHAGVRWSASGSESGAGRNRAPVEQTPHSRRGEALACQGSGRRHIVPTY